MDKLEHTLPDSDSLALQNSTTVVILTTWRENVVQDLYSVARANIFVSPLANLKTTKLIQRKSAESASLVV
jgi:hypothetical protein